MTNNTVIPQPVKDFFDDYIKEYGNNIVRLGEKNRKEYYHFEMEGDNGYPIVVEYNGSKVSQLPGFVAIDILASFVKD